MSMTAEERRKWAYAALDQWLKNHEAHELLVQFDDMFSDVGESLRAYAQDLSDVEDRVQTLEYVTVPEVEARLVRMIQHAS